MEAQLEDEAESEEELPPFPPLYTAIIGPLGTVGQHGDNWLPVLTLLQQRADVNEQTEQGWTPLMASGSTGQPEMMRLLLRCGASPRILDFRGNSALDWSRHAVVGHSDDIVLTMTRTARHEECVALCLAASEAWSPATHSLFPQKARSRAVELLLLGSLLSQRIISEEEVKQSEREAQTLGSGFLDAWIDAVMPHAISREPDGQLPQCTVGEDAIPACDAMEVGSARPLDMSDTPVLSTPAALFGHPFPLADRIDSASSTLPDGLEDAVSHLLLHHVSSTDLSFDVEATSLAHVPETGSPEFRDVSAFLHLVDVALDMQPRRPTFQDFASISDNHPFT